MPTGRPLSPATIEAIRLGYLDLDTPVRVTAERFGVHRGTVIALASEHCWRPRRSARVTARSRGRDEVGEAGSGGDPLDRLMRMAERTMAALEQTLASGQAVDPERLSRALVTQVRMQERLDALRARRDEEPQIDDEPPPRTLAELRDELRRHLERVQAEEWEARQLRGEADPA